MRYRRIVADQRVAPVKVERSRELRRRQTPEESRLWAALRRAQWDGPPFRRQQVIDGFIADFYCDAAGLVVEVDGPVHQTQADYDRERDRVLRSHSLRLLRVSNKEVRENLPSVLTRIRAACMEASAVDRRIGEAESARPVTINEVTTPLHKEG